MVCGKKHGLWVIRMTRATIYPFINGFPFVRCLNNSKCRSLILENLCKNLSMLYTGAERVNTREAEDGQQRYREEGR